MAFGALKARWRRLATEITSFRRWVPLIVAAACVLHKIFIIKDEPLPTENLQEYVDRERAMVDEEVCLSNVDEFPTLAS